MTLKTRKFLFYGLSLIFLLVGATTLLYSRGTIIDFKTLKLVQTGGIYIKSSPPDADIKLDGKTVRNTAGILQAGTFINNLVPQKYRITLSKSGYKPWQKETEVLPTQVAVFDQIVLVSDKDAENISQPVEDFYESEGRIVYKNHGRLLAGEKRLIGNEVASLLPNGSIITYNSQNNSYYLSNLSSLTSSLNLSLTFNNLKESLLNLPGTVPINKIYPYPYNDKKFIVKTAKALYALDVENMNLELITSKLSEFTMGKSEVFWKDGSEFWTYSLPLKFKSKIADVPTKNALVKIEIFPSDDLAAFLENNGKLTLVHKNNGKVRLIAEKAKDFAISHNSKLIAFYDFNGLLKIYDLDSGKYIELNKEPKNVETIAWYRDNAHILFSDNGNLYFGEIDDRKPQNIYELANGVTKFIYDKNLNRIYFSKTSGLFSLEI